MNNLSSSARSVNNSIKANSSIMDATEAGLGEIVDADLAKEAAMLSAAQAKQQLAGQSLSISNKSQQTLLSLFQ
jgi:flagellin